MTDILKDQILRIMQEALSNIRKHAQAKRVEVFVTSQEDALTLIVSDDGCGFDLLNIAPDGTGGAPTIGVCAYGLARMQLDITAHGRR